MVVDEFVSFTFWFMCVFTCVFVWVAILSIALKHVCTIFCVIDIISMMPIIVNILSDENAFENIGLFSFFFSPL